MAGDVIFDLSSDVSCICGECDFVAEERERVEPDLAMETICGWRKRRSAESADDGGGAAGCGAILRSFVAFGSTLIAFVSTGDILSDDDVSTAKRTAFAVRIPGLLVKAYPISCSAAASDCGVETVELGLAGRDLLEDGVGN